MEKRFAYIVKETGKVAAIRDSKDDKALKDRDDLEVVEVDDDVQSGMWRQKNGKFADERDSKLGKAKKADESDGSETADPAKLAPRDQVAPDVAAKAGLEPMDPDKEARAQQYASLSVTSDRSQDADRKPEPKGSMAAKKTPAKRYSPKHK